MHRVVIVGGGVGGLVTATHPARRLSGSDKAVGLSVDANRGFRIDPGFVKRTSGRSLCAPIGELSDESYS
jgi:NADH dehydrogenase FAD-containing subunit